MCEYVQLQLHYGFGIQDERWLVMVIIQLYRCCDGIVWGIDHGPQIGPFQGPVGTRGVKKGGEMGSILGCFDPIP